MADYELVNTFEAQTYLQLDAAPAGLDQLITNISARVEAYTGRWFVSRPAGRQRYQVDYTAGVCADTATVPADVKQACLEWIAARYNRPDPVITREQLEDYSYSADEKNGMPANVKAALSLYVVPRGY